MGIARAVLPLIAATTLALEPTAARTWTDATGQYTLEADLIAFDDNAVIVQRSDHELAALPIEKLSAADRKYLKSKEALEAREAVTGRQQTWALAGGMNIVGKVVDFVRRDITIQRRRGRIYVNDRVLDNLPEIYQRMLPAIVNHFESINPVDRAGFERWVLRQRGQPRSFPLEGVLMEFENGDEYAIPFFFFSGDDLQLLKSGWDRWLAYRDEADRRAQQAFFLQSLAAARQRDAAVRREIALMNLNLQAVQAGLTSLWEVTLYPATGNLAPPQWIVVPGRDSRQATANALAQAPGFVAGPVRRVAPRL